MFRLGDLASLFSCSECGQWVLARRFLFVLNVWVSCGKEIDTEARSAGIAFWAV